MNLRHDEDICDGCGARGQVHEEGGNELCSECHSLVKTLRHNPQRIVSLCKLLKLDLNNEKAAAAPTKPIHELPDVLDAVRFRTRDRELNSWYISVSEINGEPVEIFASTAFDRDHHLQSRISNLTTITRLISLILRHVCLGEVLTLEKTLKQLYRSSRQKNDLPYMLTKVLSKYCKTPTNIFTED